MGTRVIFAMGRDGLFWAGGSNMNAAGTPDTATLVTTAIAVALIVTGTFQRLAAMTSFFFQRSTTPSVASRLLNFGVENLISHGRIVWLYPWFGGHRRWRDVFGCDAVLVTRLTELAALGLLAVGLVGRVALTRRATPP